MSACLPNALRPQRNDSKIVLDVDPLSAPQASVNRQEIARQLYARLEGITATTLYDGNQTLPVRVVANRQKNSVAQLSAVKLAARSPAPPQQTPLASLMELKLGSDVGAIVHIDGQRTDEVKAYLAPGVLPEEVLKDFKRRLAASDFVLPAGYDLRFGG